MRGWLNRVAGIVVGALLLYANANGGTFLGFYAPTNGQAVGFDLAKLAIYALAVWAIYRGIRPKKWPAPAEESAT